MTHPTPPVPPSSFPPPHPQQPNPDQPDPQPGDHKAPGPQAAQPHPGQPGPGQPGPGQPQPGHPYPGQPHPGRPNATQPIPGYPTPPPGSQRTGRRSATPIVATALIAGLLGGAVALGGQAVLDHTAVGTSSTAPTLTTAAPTPAAPSQPGSITYAAQAASKYTADIQVTGAQGVAVGSGIVLSQDGYVLTNNHVVSALGSGATISATTADQDSHPATVVGTAPSYDLAVIKLGGVSGLTPAPIGSSADLQVGEQVVAVGSPESLSNTVTSGIISALSRTVTAGDGQGSQVTVYNGLQTDTPINPGNSGGPLVNLQGQVIGVNSAVDTGSGASDGVQAFGLGFAIPIDTASRVANELLHNGQATKPVLGVTGSIAATNAAATTQTSGAQITDVQANGPAAAAGLSSGDVITKVGDQRISSYADLMAAVLGYSPGQSVPLTVRSGGSEHTVTVTLGSVVDTEQTTVPQSTLPQRGLH
ncbi:S1C family serine protease [Gordonia desulfuricans]|uniref:S1C family serine protease n=1 Tax=Gordonia desulfuricans TaxID=89051 RepID=UPI0035A228F4